MLYEILLPARTNSGVITTEARMKWEHEALYIAGGYTRLIAADGVWRGERETHCDVMIPYHVACNSAQWNALVAKAFELFPDQEAIFTARIGDAEIIGREEANGNSQG